MSQPTPLFNDQPLPFPRRSHADEIDTLMGKTAYGNADTSRADIVTRIREYRDRYGNREQSCWPRPASTRARTWNANNMRASNQSSAGGVEMTERWTIDWVAWPGAPVEGYAIRDSDGRVIATLNAVASGPPKPLTPAEITSSAHLIAAAPALLAAAEAALNWIECIHPDNGDVHCTLCKAWSDPSDKAPGHLNLCPALSLRAAISQARGDA